MKSYTTVIDLTSRGKSAEQPEDAFLKEPDPALPQVTIEDLDPQLIEAAQNAGWDQLMPVQSRALPYILAGRDLIVQSRTGSGKTGAFLLPLFKLIDPDVHGTQALVLVPTRELARQVEEAFQELRGKGGKTAELTSVAVYGGVGYKHQIRAFKQGVEVVVGTPGRILDHIQKGTLPLKKLRVLILDEADEMLSMGFMPDMIELRRHVPSTRASYMYSATIPYKVRQLGREFLSEPGFLSLSEGKVHVDTMAHRYYMVGQMDKDEVLRRLIEKHNPESAIIFSNTKRKVDYLATMLRNYGFNARPISGDLPQNARERVMAELQKGEIRLLVATDVAARGIDISDLSHVFMYDVPQDPEYYIHRAGRTARAGKTGMALTLATMLDQAALQAIERRYDIDMERVEPPTEEELRSRIEDRAALLLEDEWRARSPDEKKIFAGMVDFARELATSDGLSMLAMLIDAFYHQHVHLGHTSRRGARLGSEDAIDKKDLLRRLQEIIDQKSMLRQKRIERFKSLIEQMLQEDIPDDEQEGGEPELLGMLLADFAVGRLEVRPPSKPPPPQSQERGKFRKGGRQRDRKGGSRSRSGRSRK